MPEESSQPSQLQIDHLLDILATVDPSSEFFTPAAEILETHLVPNLPPWPAATPRKQAPSTNVAQPSGCGRDSLQANTNASEPRPSGSGFMPSGCGLNRTLLTIGMATFDDYDGVFFSIQAIRMFHPEVLPYIDFLVIDNHPTGPCARALKDLEKLVENYRYVPYDRAQGTAVRDFLFRESDAEFILCMDSHVLFAPGALAQLIAYLLAHPETNDLLQGPLLSDSLRPMATHFDPKWSHGMFGVWAIDERAQDPAAAPFDIPMQGLGVFVCRRDAWPGFNPRLVGFGGEEGYVHEKIRRAGGRTLCLPFLRWLHRFERPMGTPYRPNWHDRIRNYVIIQDELGFDLEPVQEHFSAFLGADQAQPMIQSALKELGNPFFFFDAIYCINLDRASDRWEAMQRRFRELGIEKRVRRFAAIETPHNHQIGCALSHRSIIAEAKQLHLENVLVFEDDARFSPDAIPELRNSLDELKRREWYTLYLGGHRWGQSFEKAAGCRYLEVPHQMTCAHAIAYNHTIYDRILAAIPASAAQTALWCRQHHAIDKFLARCFDGLHLVTAPVISSQHSILRQETRAFED